MKFEYVVSAKTVQDAYSKAVDLYSSLGEITMEEVIKQGKKGFLGIGAENAEIKISVDDGKEDKSAKKQEVKQENQKKPQQNRPQPKQNNTQKKEEKQPVARREAVVREPLKDEDIKVLAKEKEIAINFLKSFIQSIGYNCEVKGDLTTDAEGYVSREITIEGEGASTLIGHHGDTLDSLQYLTNLCLARKSEGEHKEYIKVIVDIENYRAKREETLRNLARRMSEKALKQQRNIHLDPMNPYERRIIHSEVQKIDGVSTHSVGYDENRKIVITVDKK